MNTLVAGILVALIIAIAGFGCGHRVGKEGAELKASNQMSEHMLEDENLRVEAEQRATAASADVTTAVHCRASGLQARNGRCGSQAYWCHC